ncbi:MAG TPA: TetR/AcrR family transcriptional regulator [Chryseolinea sp.]|nr:TetR/AcrR family transcriptional regulator [Chryseolinea sp.]HPM32790.1 TetR/AcrR family transcriptional regulator [Chryseolinea sp.]
MKESTYLQHWLTTGYTLFAQEGLEGIQVERIARTLNLNKSGFYHHFGDKNSYLEALMNKHVNLADPLVQDFKQVRHFDPQFMEVLIKYTTPVMVHNQLVRNRQDDLLFKTYHQVNEIVDPVVARLFADFIGFQDHLDFTTKYYSQVRDMFYTQISFERMNYPFLRDFLNQSKEVIQHAAAIASKPNF